MGAKPYVGSAAEQSFLRYRRRPCSYGWAMTEVTEVTEVTEKEQRDLADALEQLPEVAGLTLTFLGAGTDHLAFDAGRRFVFRVPRSADAASSSESERRLTALLAPRLPLAIPLFRFVIEPTERLPFGATGYARLPGTPALGLVIEPPRRRSLARALGAFLRVLHDVEPSVVSGASVAPDDDPTLEAWRGQALDDALAAVRAGAIDRDVAASLIRSLEAPPTEPYAPSLIHGDFAAEHVLLEADGTVSGVIDWSDAMIGDRALDLAGFVHWGGDEMLSEALETYGPCDVDTLARARWFAACRAVADIVFGLGGHRPEYVTAGQRALRHLNAPPVRRGDE